MREPNSVAGDGDLRRTRVDQDGPPAQVELRDMEMLANTPGTQPMIVALECGARARPIKYWRVRLQQRDRVVNSRGERWIPFTEGPRFFPSFLCLNSIVLGARIFAHSDPGGFQIGRIGLRFCE